VSERRPGAITYLRSALFMAAMLVVTPTFVTLLLCCFWLPLRSRRLFVMPYVNAVMWMVRHILGIRHRVVGAENIPAVPCVILCKHQSAWETFALQQVFRLTSFVYKRELHWLPFFGWGLWLMPFVAIDRGAGKEALNQVASRGKERLADGYSVVIFPEGTRVAPGHKKRFKVGGAWLASQAGVPAVPVALDSGECWRRQAFLKTPGLVTMSIGPAIDPAGLKPEEINARAEAWIESEMRRISPHRYRHETPPAATVSAA
jgi:1-acyl-sn-glycerol-3-phosphate acyltransferase